MGSKKHKKHKSDRWDRYESAQEQGADRPQLRLILKVGGGSSTPDPGDHSNSSFIRHTPANIAYNAEEESRQSSHYSYSESGDRERHKKKKEKKKKKNKDKDKEKKKHKHHKEKKRKDKDEPSDELDETCQYQVVSVPPPASFVAGSLSPRPILKISTAPVEVMGVTPASVSRGVRTSLRPRPERPALQKLLELLLPTLERKDPRQFFAWPVTDSIAPGYSTIITKPMDFSTMKQKIEDNLYRTLQEFSDDFVLMCNNAMTYNQPDTVYYKSAKRLLHAGLRNLTPEKVRPIVPTISNFGELTVAHLGFEPLEESFKAHAIRQEQAVEGVGEAPDHDMEADFSSGGETFVETARDIFLKNESPGKSPLDALPDDLTPEEILEQVQEAAQMAASKREYQHPNAKMGFIRQRKDGTTSLAILTPCDPASQPGTTEVPVALGALTGKVQPGPGTGQLLGFREDRRNLAKTVKPLYYGPFGSYAPSYDSTFANLTKEESDLVLSTYGEETGVAYAESIIDFVRDCDYALNIADDLLNLMTHGEHSAVSRILEEKRRIYQQQVLQQLEQEKCERQYLKSQERSENTFDFSSLRSLSDFGIDVSFIDSFEAQLKNEQRAREASQNCLDETGNLISALERTQRERLSRTPPPHLSNIMQPSEMELHLAEKITEGIAFVAKNSTPANLASIPGVRKAMGVAVEPLSVSSSTVQPDTNMGTDQRDIENELCKLLGEDEGMAELF